MTQKENMQATFSALEAGQKVVLESFMYKGEKHDKRWLQYIKDEGVFLFSSPCANASEIKFVHNSSKRVYAKEAVEMISRLEESKDKNGDAPIKEAKTVAVKVEKKENGKVADVRKVKNVDSFIKEVIEPKKGKQKKSTPKKNHRALRFKVTSPYELKRIGTMINEMPES